MKKKTNREKEKEKILQRSRNHPLSPSDNPSGQAAGRDGPRSAERETLLHPEQGGAGGLRAVPGTKPLEGLLHQRQGACTGRGVAGVLARGWHGLQGQPHGVSHPACVPVEA